MAKETAKSREPRAKRDKKKPVESEEESESEQQQDRTPVKSRKRIQKSKNDVTPKKSSKTKAQKIEEIISDDSEQEQLQKSNNRKKKGSPSEVFDHEKSRDTILNLVMSSKKASFQSIWDSITDKYTGISETQFSSLWQDLEKEGAIYEDKGVFKAHKDEIDIKEAEKRRLKEEKEKMEVEQQIADALAAEIKSKEDKKPSTVKKNSAVKSGKKSQLKEGKESRKGKEEALKEITQMEAEPEVIQTDGNFIN